MSQEFLFVLWAGGGNVPPQLTLARRLVARGHRVRMLGPAVLREKIEAAGIAFEPYREIPEHDESVRDRSLVRDFEARSKAAALAAARDNLVAAMARPVATDVLATLERRPADVVAFDFLLFGALFAAERAAVPAAMLIHTIYPFPAPGLPPYGMGWAPMVGPLGTLREAVGRLIFRQMYERPLLPRFNAVRAGLGLEPLHTFDELIGRVERALVLTSPAFDFPARLPANVEYVGPQLDPPAPTPDWQSPWSPGDDRPLVVVGLSTTHQAHDPLLERVLTALGTLPVRALVTTGGATLQSTPPANVHVARYVPHARVLPQAAAVVTHAGLGTVHAALAHGLPLVCLPIGRDQPDNAARVEWHGAGVRLSPKSSPAVIGAAVKRVLEDPGFAASARRLAAALAEQRPAQLASRALEAVAGHAGSKRAATPRTAPASEVVSPG
ncbi:MAG TPA: nucleotide disphospho-sugar-binding domain-containing protein [Solirubrobacteraceae bacterium]|nr:nucleotide disphospho-sugar-binding domain-containing protein [Solirubrobacteraceae bacterium]